MRYMPVSCSLYLSGVMLALAVSAASARTPDNTAPLPETNTGMPASKAPSPAATPQSGQADSNNVTELPAITVTATMSEVDADTAPATMTIIDRQEIRTRGAGDLRDALAGEPGVAFTQAGGAGRQSVSLRGLAGHHVLTLIDGRRVPASDDVFGHADYQYGWLPMVAIERIEIIRGPMSTLYGSEALGGVVNMITRKPDDEWRASLATKGALSAGGGPDAKSGSASFFVAGPVSKRLGLRVFGESARQQATPNPERPEYSELEGRRLNMGGVSAWLDISPEHRLVFSHEGGRETRSYDAMGRGTATDPAWFHNIYQLKRSNSSIEWQGKPGMWITSLQAYRNKINVHNWRSSGARATDPQTLSNDVITGHASRPFGSHLLTVGSEWRRETLENTDLHRGRDSARHMAFFLQDEIELSDQLGLTASLRHDRHQTAGSELSPRLYLVWQASDSLTIKGGYAHAFRAPTLKQSSAGYAGVQGIYTFYGNPEIRPERLDSYELSVNWNTDNLGLQLTAFHSRAKDLIVNRRINRIGIREFYRPENVQRARISGIETSLGWRMSDTLTWTGSLGLLRTRDSDTGKELEYRPRLNASARLDYAGPDGWSARIGLRHTGSQYREGTRRLPAYTIWDASIARELGRHYTIRLGANNIGNVRLADKSPDFRHAERGRVIYLDLQADF